MGAEDFNAAQHVQNASEIMDSIRHAAKDFMTAQSLSRAKTAIRNFVEQSRSLTWALENLKTGAEDRDEWDRWWTAITAELRENPVGNYFYALRNPIVKRGQPVEIHTVRQTTQSFSISTPSREEWPAGAVSCTIDTQFQTWFEMEDGSRVLYRPEPTEGIRRWYTLGGIPKELYERGLEDLMSEYVVVLQGVLVAAVARYEPIQE